MKKMLGLLLVFFFIEIPNAIAQDMQFPIVDLYDIGSMDTYVNTVREMNQRVVQIMKKVKPDRELQYKYYREGKYREAVELCYDVYRQYVYYVYDNRAISDMEVLAGDCALKIGAYESAIDWYLTAQRAEVNGMDSRLGQVFYAVMADAKSAYESNDYNTLWKHITIASKTGWESGEIYYYYGACYEKFNDLRNAKKMYKLAKKKNYIPAITALQKLKKRK